ncbi:transcriptional regulator [Nonlabens tegetincola]
MCFDSAGRADLGLVYGVADALGVANQPVRLAIRRLESAGEATQHGRGRGGVLERTGSNPFPDPVAAGRLRRARGLADGTVTWDGNWRLTSFSFPDERRADRDALRAALTRLGCVLLAPGLYLSTTDPRAPLSHYAPPAVRRLVGELIVAEVTKLDVAGVSDPAALVARLWSFAEAGDAYAIADAAVRADAGPHSDIGRIEHAARALRLAEPFARALALDPLLPPELVPARWSTRAIHARFSVAWDRYVETGGDLELYRQFKREV